MQVQDAGLSSAPRAAPPAGLGSGGHAGVEGMAGEGLSPLSCALQPRLQPLRTRPSSGEGALQSGVMGRERRRPAPPASLPAP